MSNMAINQEREWLLPCVVMTISLALAALLLRPASGVGSSEFFSMFPTWASYVLIAEIGYPEDSGNTNVGHRLSKRLIFEIFRLLRSTTP